LFSKRHENITRNVLSIKYAVIRIKLLPRSLKIYRALLNRLIDTVALIKALNFSRVIRRFCETL